MQGPTAGFIASSAMEVQIGARTEQMSVGDDMLQSRVTTFTDPYAFGAAILNGHLQMLVTSKGTFRAEHTIVQTDRLFLQRLDEDLPRLACATIEPGRAPIHFLADLNDADNVINGQEYTSADIIFYGRRTCDHLRSLGPCSNMNMSLTEDDLASTAEAITGREIAAPPATTIIRPAPAALEKLRSLHAAATRLAKTTPELLALPAISRAIEHELIRAMIVCMAGGDVAEVKACSWQRSQTMRRFEEFLAARQHEPVYAAEICAAIGVSERALRASCHERLGMGPVRYLWLRRMHLARQTLLRVEASTSTVTAIATTCGFWELGRFSVEYRALFGEQPSVTLQRPPDDGYAGSGLPH
jgi:AraC-like DNA-binding protein